MREGSWYLTKQAPHGTPDHDEIREGIERDIATFLANNGEVTQVDFGVSGEPDIRVTKRKNHRGYVDRKLGGSFNAGDGRGKQ